MASYDSDKDLEKTPSFPIQILSCFALLWFACFAPCALLALLAALALLCFALCCSALLALIRLVILLREQEQGKRESKMR